MDFSALSMLDYIVLGIIGFSTFFALVRGFIGSFLSLAGWILSIYLAYVLYPIAQPYMQAKINNELIVLIFGHSLLLLAFLIAFGIFNVVASVALKGVSKGLIDRILGAGFGILRGGLIVSFIFFITTATLSVFKGKQDDGEKVDEYAPKWLTESQTYPILKVGKNILTDFVPDTFYARVENIYEKVTNKTLDEGFMENAAEMMYNSLSDEQKEQIAKKISEDVLTMSQDEAEKKKLTEMLKLIRSNTESGVSKKDLNRLEDLLNKNKTPSKNQEIEPVEFEDDLEELE